MTSAAAQRSVGFGSGVVWLPLFAAACGLLLARPLLHTPLGLSLVYLVLAAVSLPAGARRAGRPVVAPGYALAAGLAAVVAARAIGGIAVPVRAGVIAISLNVFAAVAEEALFRSFLYSRLERWGPSVAVLGSAISFAVVHVPAYGMAALPVNLGAGLMLSWQRWSSGRWEIPAATHSFANVVSML